MNRVFKIGDVSGENRIYQCSRCGNLHAFLQGEVFSACTVCAGKKQEWKPKKELIIRTRNVAAEIERRKTALDKFSDWLVSSFGTPWFLVFHIVWFGLWVIVNMGWTSFPVFDENWEHLTMIVSLEAIFLAIFILISQNRAGETSELRSELDYQTDLKAEKRSEEILALLQAHVKRK